jgi:hypothetical protein
MGNTLNAETVLASIIELRKSIADSQVNTEKANKELRESMAKETAELRESIANLKTVTEKNNAEFRSSMEKSNAELRAIVEKSNERLDINSKKLDDNNRKLDNNNHVVGLLCNKLGSIVESIVLPGIVEKFNEKGFTFDAVSTNIEFMNKKKSGNLAEVDALLENGKFVIVVESKTDMAVKDVNDHIKRLVKLRTLQRFKGKKIYGAISTAVARKRAVNYALEQGFYVLQQPDVLRVKILDFPKGRSAKAW